MNLSLEIRNEASFHLDKVSHGLQPFLKKYFKEKSCQTSLSWCQADFGASHASHFERQQNISIGYLAGCGSAQKA